MLTKETVLAGFSVLLFSCTAGPGTDIDENQEIIENLVQVGFPTNDIQVVDGKVYVGNDAEVSLAASREMLLGGDSTDEQYRTTNLINGIPNVAQRICVNGAAYTGNLSTGLNLAISNFNALFNTGAIRLQFQRVNGGPVAGCTFFINGVTLAGVTGGSSGFPSGGAPFNTIRIGTGLAGFSADVNEHVITHEIGHTLGFRHSDFFNRSISCGGAATNEGQSGVGAILIPGTPNGATVGGSIMNSCFRSTETGEFTASDVTALSSLY